MAVLPAGSAEMHPGGVVVGDYDPVDTFPATCCEQIFYSHQAVFGVNRMAVKFYAQYDR